MGKCIVDILALIVSGISMILVWNNNARYKKLQSQYNDMVNVQTLTAQGALETQIRSSISESVYYMALIGVEMAKDTENAGNELLQQAYYAAEETYRNAYEDACGKYLDGKVDKNRFKKLYNVEIRRLVEDEPYKRYYENNQSAYTSTLTVYREWFRQA